MNRLTKYIFLILVTISCTLTSYIPLHAAEDEPVYTTLRSIDLGTFNEYRYRLTEQFFLLREGYEVNGEMEREILAEMTSLADTAYKFLPDNLKNKNYLNELFIDIKRAVRSPTSDVAYTQLIRSLASYLEDVEIDSITATVYALPVKGNAPMVTTFRVRASDPSGTQIKNANYTWWIDNAGEVEIIGRGPSINYTFREEGKFSVFLDITSSHKNEAGFTDVLPYREKVQVLVEEKIASLIVKVNGERVGDNYLKFTPEDARYGLIFDATSSTPSDGSRFSRTQWSFGNGVRRSYNGSPKIERIKYGDEGEYPVSLILTTNEGKSVQKNFVLSIRDPIATIDVNRDSGFIGDKFTFSAKTAGNFSDLSYSWEIVNIDTDRVVHQRSDRVMSYSFSDKGKYNVKLKVRRSTGEIDQDTKIVYVNSQAPIAEFESSIPLSHKPNRVLLDASRSYDPDISDDGNLTYEWTIDGKRVNLEEASLNGAIGYYTFDSIGTHSVNLEVTDPDGILTIKKGSVEVESILSVEMYAFPRVIQRENFIRFTAESQHAEVYEWDFGDGKTAGGNKDTISHTYSQSGTFDVVLTVSDKDNNKNSFTRTVYVSDSEKPLAIIDASLNTLEVPRYDSRSCQGRGAYVVDRVHTIKFDGTNSINTDGTTTDLEYSWKVGQSKFSTSTSVSHRFDEIGCFPVKLTVKSKNNGKIHSREVMMSVENLKPTLSSVKVDVTNPRSDPLVVELTAQGAKDLDGVIQSYLWYYYTDIDPEPQDFRATVSAQTSFVLPRITGNYYFVVILKDNNEAKANSEEITGAKYYTTITGDNINTPIIEFSVNDNSVVIGEEVVFQAKAKNILDKNLGKEAVFSWDFDGDGFYDTQTSSGETTYSYKKSGEFYPKVKVKYRGISSTKNISVNVSNALTPDFEYISLGNRFIFFDTSLGQVESYTWDLGDTTKKSESSFEHTYTDKKSSHIVSLQISEGTKTKSIEKKVVKNVRNLLKKRGKDLVIFSSPALQDENEVSLKEGQKLFLYLAESTDEAVKYLIDYDLDYDSDLNGSSDDDADNAGEASESTGSIQMVELSDFREQKIRVYIQDAQGKTLASEDILVIKDYIEQQNIDPDTLVFEGVSQSEREKIESLKKILAILPQHKKLEAYHFIQKLQENWTDTTEKTRTILDFEAFIFELGLQNEDEIISILESLLVEGQEDQSERQIVYQALMNLIPQGINCETQGETCREKLIGKLTLIRESTSVENNKVIGKEILEIIALTDLMTQSQKLDFKAILSSLVYGQVENIPESEKAEIIQGESESIDEDMVTSGSGIFGILVKILGYIIVIFFALIAILYIAYHILKQGNENFTTFITRITSGNTKNETESGDDEFDISDDDTDILGADQLEQKQEQQESDILSPAKKPIEKPSQGKPSPQKTVTPEQDKKILPEKKQALDVKEKEEVPDWLKGNFDISSEDTPKNTSEKTPVSNTPPVFPHKPQNQDTLSTSQETLKIEKNTSPTQQKAGEKISKSSPVSAQEQHQVSQATPPTKAVSQTPPSNIKKQEQSKKSFDLEKDTKIPSEDNIPDWLKGTFDTPPAEETKNTPSYAAEKSVEKAQVTPPTKKVEVPKTAEVSQRKEAPKKSLEKKADESRKDTPAKAEKKKPVSESVVPKTTPKKEKTEDTQKSDTKEPTLDTPKIQEKKSLPKDKQVSKDTQKESKAEQKTEKLDEQKPEELWDDGMKVPDWLKNDTK